MTIVETPNSPPRLSSLHSDLYAKRNHRRLLSYEITRMQKNK